VRAVANNVLHLDNVTMQFGGVVAVSDLSLDVNEGEIVALIGPNGAGKTTAFNVITGVYAPTNGRVVLRGQTISEGYPTGKMKKLYAAGHNGEYTKLIANTPDKITAKGVARTFQNIRLFKDLTVFENVLIAKHMHVKANVISATFRLNWAEEARIRRESLDLIDSLGLSKVKDEKAAYDRPIF
jgi:branched-chain amino acid transport system ATP-binding protein